VQLKFSVTQTHAFGDVIHAPESAKFFLCFFNKTQQLYAERVYVISLDSEWDTGPPQRSGPLSIFLCNNNLRI
jgi:hypothetical protein